MFNHKSPRPQRSVPPAHGQSAATGNEPETPAGAVAGRENQGTPSAAFSRNQKKGKNIKWQKHGRLSERPATFQGLIFLAQMFLHLGRFPAKSSLTGKVDGIVKVCTIGSRYTM